MLTRTIYILYTAEGLGSEAVCDDEALELGWNFLFTGLPHCFLSYRHYVKGPRYGGLCESDCRG